MSVAAQDEAIAPLADQPLQLGARGNIVAFVIGFDANPVAPAAKLGAAARFL
jgi:hypothetical protein